MRRAHVPSLTTPGVLRTCGGLHCVSAAPSASALPCQEADADLWFADDPRDLERAKAMCADCPLRAQCLQAALDRAEPWGVWGGEIFERGAVIARKRPPGRPRKTAA